jgi:transcription termination factor Rho
VSVLRRSELDDSPLADLHAIAVELGLEGYRAMRREDLVKAILGAQGEGNGDDPEPEPEVDVADGPAEPGAAEDAPATEEDEAPEPEQDQRPAPAGEEEPEVVDRPITEEETASGMLDILPNGSGFLRVGENGQSSGDVYVSPAQIRRCELRAGDQVSGPLRPPRRNERHPSLVRIEKVNGADAEPPEQRPLFDELRSVFPSQRLDGPEGVVFGRGSRVAVGGAPGAGATTLLREFVAKLGEGYPEIELQVVLVGVRPEEAAEWRAEAKAPVSGGSFDSSPDAQAQAAELAVERAKRNAERGGHAAVVIDRLDALPAGAQRRVFGAGRATEEGGTVTVVAATGSAEEPLRWATTRVVLAAPDAGAATLRADSLGA